MDVTVRRGARFVFDGEVPGDKSISHRAVLLAALGDGRSRVCGLAPGDDVARTVAAVQALGARVDRSGDELAITGAPGRAPDGVIDCGNSGTTMRLLAGVAAGRGLDVTLDGDESLRKRPMARVTEPLRAMGGRVRGRTGDDGDERAPLTIKAGAPLTGQRHDLEVSSAQVKGALLLAGLFAEGQTTVRTPVPVRDHTERLLSAIGVEVQEGEDGSVTVTGGHDRLPALGELWVPGDPSSAAYLLAAGALARDGDVSVRGCCLARGRDGFLRALERMGARAGHAGARRSRTGTVADVTATSGAALRSLELGADHLPAVVDEVPLLALVATQAEGTTRITGAEELRHKESDRLTATARMLRMLGGDVEQLADGLVISGPTPLHGATIDPAGDHRIAMTAAIAGTLTDDGVVVKETSCVRVSWPAFFDVLGATGAHVE